MSNWPLLSPGVPIPYGADAASSTAVSASAGASYTKGAWAELVSALPTQCAGVLLTVAIATTNAAYAFDVGIGSAGSEIVVASDLLLAIPNRPEFVGTYRFVLPIMIDQGQRVAIRASSSSGSALSFVAQIIAVAPSPLWPVLRRKMSTYNVNAATNLAASYCDAGGTVNTKGAWVEICAVTPHPITSALLVANSGPSNGFAVNFLLDLGVGAAGTEHVVVPNIHHRTETASGRTSFPALFPVTIPAGVRVSARVQCTSSNSAHRNLGVILYLA